MATLVYSRWSRVNYDHGSDGVQLLVQDRSHLGGRSMPAATRHIKLCLTGFAMLET